MRQLCGVVGIVGVLLGVAATHGAAAAGPADDPLVVVKATSEDVIRRLIAEPERYRDDPQALYDMVREVAFPHFDLERSAQWVLGRHWRDATAQQRTHFIESFSTLLLRTYATAMTRFDPSQVRDFAQRIRYLPVRMEPGAQQVVVRTQIRRDENAPPAAVDFKLTHRSGTWKVYDATIEGISLVLTYRVEYDGIIRREGLEGLLGRLDARNRERAPTVAPPLPDTAPKS